MSTETDSITLTRTLDAPRETLWRAWTDPEIAARWWHPHDVTVAEGSTHIDLRVGGEYGYLMVDRDGGEYPTGGTYLELDPPGRLVCTWREPGDEDGIAPVLTLDLADLGDGRTEMTFHLAKVPGESHEGIDSGWREAFEELETTLARGDVGPAADGRERMIRSRVVPLPAEAIFAVLADPARHHETEPGDWVRSAVDPQPITQVGQVFSVNMFVEGQGDYVMDNRVVALEPDRVIAWAPGQYDDRGELGPTWWTWRYDLAPSGDGTEVTITYDWTDTPDFFRREVPMPPFPAEFLDESLASLEQAAGSSR
ncbi:hypothetical protein GCM10027055_26500 [Janibacter alkaliphilus]|uniref:Uncharacterized protein YndB with AHSA1/START domain n=1 Tax=Janibacter alkaliphilus TaxID=1069963 RepID=A0A852X500_9MICO|nr:SRPBCC family protein [Janibacter alkaliphilus]NYG37989.1 uncharacterized protein YndB with AHSA1/START domain [Janibacter alkaliphilus]